MTGGTIKGPASLSTAKVQKGSTLATGTSSTDSAWSTWLSKPKLAPTSQPSRTGLLTNNHIQEVRSSQALGSIRGTQMSKITESSIIASSHILSDHVTGNTVRAPSFTTSSSGELSTLNSLGSPQPALAKPPDSASASDADYDFEISSSKTSSSTPSAGRTLAGIIEFPSRSKTQGPKTSPPDFASLGMQISKPPVGPMRTSSTSDPIGPVVSSSVSALQVSLAAVIPKIRSYIDKPEPKASDGAIKSLEGVIPIAKEISGSIGPGPSPRKCIASKNLLSDIFNAVKCVSQDADNAVAHIKGGLKDTEPLKSDLQSLTDLQDPLKDPKTDDEPGNDYTKENNPDDDESDEDKKSSQSKSSSSQTASSSSPFDSLEISTTSSAGSSPVTSASTSSSVSASNSSSASSTASSSGSCISPPDFTLPPDSLTDSAQPSQPASIVVSIPPWMQASDVFGTINLGTNTSRQSSVIATSPGSAPNSVRSGTGFSSGGLVGSPYFGSGTAASSPSSTSMTVLASSVISSVIDGSSVISIFSPTSASNPSPNPSSQLTTTPLPPAVASSTLDPASLETSSVPYSQGRCSLDLQQWSIVGGGDYTIDVVMYDNSHSLLANSSWNEASAKQPLSVNSPLQDPLLVIPESRNDYVQFRLGNQAWPSNGKYTPDQTPMCDVTSWTSWGFLGKVIATAPVD
ncbi:hypothetical protein ACLMJK_006292 [Lecanora helva]